MSLLLFALMPPATASSSGRTGSSTTGCGGGACHATASSALVTNTFSPDATTVAPGDALLVDFVVASSSSTHRAGGLDISATGGTLVAGSNTQTRASEITHTHELAFASGSATFEFSWTAPAVEGTYTLRGVGMAVNNNSSQDAGDNWSRATDLTITVDDGCDDLDLDGWEGCDDGSGADCDDSDVAISPDGIEACDGVDEDCDGLVDDDPADGTEYAPDADEDGHGDATAAPTRSCEPIEGYSAELFDCDDGDAAVSPDATELCDGIDNDCDGTADGSDSADAATFWADLDADGFGDAASPMNECSLPSGYAVLATDCDDTRAVVNPDAAEECDSLGRDEDCDGAVDDADGDVIGTTTFYLDGDGDGYGAGATATASACLLPVGYAAASTDCDDGDARFNPGAAEPDCTDPADYNCDGSTGFVDGDGDGWSACEDCDDADAAASPSATETCDGRDDDCDGRTDEPDASDAAIWFVDADADGWGSLAAYQLACDAPTGYAASPADCDDADAGARPDAPEVWYDGVDQDCDGADDDQDGDGFDRAEDCVDTDGAIHPGADDAPYDGIDADCAGDSDDDADGDGQDAGAQGGDDCDDADPGVYTGAPDAPYDGIVQDCDDADEFDADGDGFDLDEDCDDSNSSIHPDAEELWYDGVDQNCDLNDDDQDGDGAAVTIDCADLDPTLWSDCDPGVPDAEEPEAKEEAPGCGCATAPSGFAPALLAPALLAPALLALVRRRARWTAGARIR